MSVQRAKASAFLRVLNGSRDLPKEKLCAIDFFWLRDSFGGCSIHPYRFRRGHANFRVRNPFPEASKHSAVLFTFHLGLEELEMVL